ncbi:beclin 1-associated autophagy-related key regulator isoform X2 [Wyeomyia smithii]|uniref:beclin 1-associated autophagy-related key regulator isoform X2 n=1 Tax=Wyeomyia smithii TaxID=174621 RepID=UPI0024680A56|nr:beclin 1-associated autophagy-related key regulator isoform X2 [Wyeomyia smithii]
MATSLTSEGGAPENFHISFGNDDDDSNLSAGSMRCPLCSYSKRNFHCRNCIRSGDFLHSSHHLLERFSEKQLRYKNLKSAHAILENKCVHLMARRRLSCQLRTEIKRKSENIAIIRQLMAQKRGNLQRLQSLKKELQESNREQRIKLPLYDDKVRKLGDYVLSKLEENERRRECLVELQNKLRILKRDNIEKLIKYIFPISQAVSNRSSFSSSDGESKNTINEISEATRTAYVRGKWVLQDSFGEIQHIIVAPALPGNGNYLAYNVWKTTNDASSSGGKNEDPNKTMANRNPAHTIAAALTYTTQLVQIMCYYLDIRFPYKVSYGDFCTTALSDGNFSRKVARLNANILYLCYAHGCRLTELNPTHTLENLQRLLNPTHAELGRLGPTDRNFCLNEQVDAALTQNLGAGEDSDSDESTLHQDWEAVPNNLPPSVEADVLHLAGTPAVQHPYSNTHRFHHQQQTRYHHPTQVAATTSLMTSAVASVTSFWKGWTGK